MGFLTDIIIYMKLEFYPLEKLKNEILSIIGKYLDLTKYKVFFFGSRVKGNGDKRSDIDIGIEGPEEISIGIIAQIQEDINDLQILYKIEIVDFKSVASDFREVALQYTELMVM